MTDDTSTLLVYGIGAISVALQSQPCLSQEDFITQEFKDLVGSLSIKIHRVDRRRAKGPPASRGSTFA